MDSPWNKVKPMKKAKENVQSALFIFKEMTNYQQSYSRCMTVMMSSPMINDLECACQWVSNRQRKLYIIFCCMAL